MNIFEKMISFGRRNNCTTLKGIIDYEIAKRRNKKELFVPVYYSDSRKVIVSFLDAIPNDYYQKAIEITNNTKKYIVEDGKSPEVDTIKNWNIKFNYGTGFFRTKAFKIKY